MTHSNCPPLECLVEKKFLYNLDPAFKDQFVKAQLIGVSSYPQEAITFQALLDDGSLFSYMPIHALRSNPHSPTPYLELADLVYKNSPGHAIEVTNYDGLAGDVHCYFKGKNLWLRGTYQFTIDWTLDNEQFHMVSLENGQFATLPNHKLKFRNGPRTFEPYQKLRQTWKV